MLLPSCLAPTVTVIRWSSAASCGIWPGLALPACRSCGMPSASSAASCRCAWRCDLHGARATSQIATRAELVTLKYDGLPVPPSSARLKILHQDPQPRPSATQLRRPRSRPIHSAVCRPRSGLARPSAWPGSMVTMISGDGTRSTPAAVMAPARMGCPGLRAELAPGSLCRARGRPRTRC